MLLLNRPEDRKAFNSNLASMAKKPTLPAWFPKPHPAHADLEIYVLTKNLKDKKTAQTYWFPPYEIFLTGDNPETAKTRWKFLLMFRSDIIDRHILSLHDSSIRPLTKKEWRNISSGAEFRSKWPQGESFPAFDPNHYWRAGLDALFGAEATARAREGICSLEDFESEIVPDQLDCDCEVSAIDWETDTQLKTVLAVSFAEIALLYEFALIDPDLTQDLGESNNRTNLPLLGNLPDHLTSNSTYMERKSLVWQVVWADDFTERRGWELDSFDERLDWVWILSWYLEPLWRKHEHLKGETMYVLTVDQVTPDIIWSLDENDAVALKKIETALLVFWSTALQRDFGVLHTPFYASLGKDPDHYCCVAHR